MKCSPSFVKYCRICGDKASGFNYNGLCCESCKVFFLRNASNNKFNCSKGNCVIDIVTRKNCGKCRLEKCIVNGMIFKTKKINKPETNSTLDFHIWNILQNTDYQNINPFDLNLPQFPYLFTRKRKYASELTAPERQMIANVQNVISDTFVDESSLRVIGAVTNVIGAFQHASMYSRKIVQFCKLIPAFKELCPKLILMKPFFYESLVTRLVYVYDSVNQGYPIIENESAERAVFSKFDLVSEFKNQDPIFQGLKFQMGLYEELENDFTIRDLFIAILLFKPRTNLFNPEFVHYQYSLYCRLLRRYLEHKYKNICKTDQKYKTLIRLTDCFDGHIQMVRSLVRSQFDTKQLPKAIIEIFDF